MGQDSRAGRSLTGGDGGSRKWKIREAGRDDVDALHALEVRAHHAPWPRHAFEEELETDETKIWAVDGPDRLAAFMAFWRVGSQIDILDIAVDPQFQRKGLAVLLLKTLIAVAPTAGVHRIVLEVRVTNDPALRLYRKLGFSKAGRRPDYYEDNGEDAFVMVRKIENERF